MLLLPFPTPPSLSLLTPRDIIIYRIQHVGYESRIIPAFAKQDKNLGQQIELVLK